MTFDEYVSWLNREYSKITVERKWTEIGPIYTPTTAMPNTAPWQMQWCLIFPDAMYLVIRENWYAVKGAHGQQGYRKDFAFHYGPANPILGELGIPKRDRDAFPPILRIDSDRHGPHLHFKGENHIFQPRVKHLEIAMLNPFDFVRAVLKHRHEGTPFPELIGFEIVPE